VVISLCIFGLSLSRTPHQTHNPLMLVCSVGNSGSNKSIGSIKQLNYDFFFALAGTYEGSIFHKLFNLIFHFISADASTMSVEMAKREVLIALSQIIDPDFGTDIVSCGFVKDLEINGNLDEVIELKLSFNKSFCINFLNNSLLQFQVSFRLELTTPACPIKDMVPTNRF
jgi:metal-sulfur cluster biosynthetic enzyme